MRICIVRLSAMGDIVHSAVVLAFIKRAYPDAQIDWVTERAFAPLLENNPHIHTIIALELKRFKKSKKWHDLSSQITTLRALEPYDYIIDMQGLIKSALVSFFIKGKRYGFDKKSARESLASSFYHKRFNIPYTMNTIERNAQIVAQSLQIPITLKDMLNKDAFLFATSSQLMTTLPTTKKKAILFIIGSTWPSRNYPTSAYAELANKLGETIYIAWGNVEEKSDADAIALHASNVTVLPKTTINDLKALIGRMDLVIGNDTGPTHIAWAMNRPSITLFGPTPTSRVLQTPINKVLKSPSKVDTLRLDKNDFSIKEIAVDTIVEMAQTLLYPIK